MRKSRRIVEGANGSSTERGNRADTGMEVFL